MAASLALISMDGNVAVRPTGSLITYSAALPAVSTLSAVPTLSLVA
ncbi:hypothetical protein [Streptomyces sp. NRRL B-1347]|nr:hypothetical protein [Streptomyces sp. NRRL B-1347]